MQPMHWDCLNLTNLTHLSISSQQIHESTISGISQAAKRESLPYLSHLSLIKCRGLDHQMKLLFKSPWPQLINLNLYGSPLDVSDYDTLSKAIDGKNVFPRLVLLVVSFTTISQETFPHITNMINMHSGLKSLFLDALTVQRGVQIMTQFIGETNEVLHVLVFR